jgi:hypothetical protein
VLRGALDDAAWNTAKAADTRKAYEDYIAATGGDPAIESRPDADNKTVEFREAGDGKHAAEVAAIVGDFLGWEDAEAAGSAEAFDTYLQNFPRGRFLATALQRKSALGEKLREAWVTAEELKTREGYEAYLKAVGCKTVKPPAFFDDPDACKTDNVSAARERLLDLDAFAEAEKSNEPSDYFVYLARYPKGLKAALAKQRCRCALP